MPTFKRQFSHAVVVVLLVCSLSPRVVGLTDVINHFVYRIPSTVGLQCLLPDGGQSSYKVSWIYSGGTNYCEILGNGCSLQTRQGMLSFSFNERTENNAYVLEVQINSDVVFDGNNNFTCAVYERSQRKLVTTRSYHIGMYASGNNPPIGNFSGAPDHCFNKDTNELMVFWLYNKGDAESFGVQYYDAPIGWVDVGSRVPASQFRVRVTDLKRQARIGAGQNLTMRVLAYNGRIAGSVSSNFTIKCCPTLSDMKPQFLFLCDKTSCEGVYGGKVCWKVRSCFSNIEVQVDGRSRFFTTSQGCVTVDNEYAILLDGVVQVRNERCGAAKVDGESSIIIYIIVGVIAFALVATFVAFITTRRCIISVNDPKRERNNSTGEIIPAHQNSSELHPARSQYSPRRIGQDVDWSEIPQFRRSLSDLTTTDHSVSTQIYSKGLANRRLYHETTRATTVYEAPHRHHGVVHAPPRRGRPSLPAPVIAPVPTSHQPSSPSLEVNALVDVELDASVLDRTLSGGSSTAHRHAPPPPRQRTYSDSTASENVFDSKNGATHGVTGVTNSYIARVMDTHRNHNCKPDRKNVLTINRRSILLDTVREFNRTDFDPYNGLYIKFVDEVAFDLGGPTREYLRLLMNAVIDETGCFEGPPHRKVVAVSTQALRHQYYQLSGMCIAVSLFHGGPGGNFLSPAIYDAVVESLETARPQIKDIIDPDVRGLVESMEKADDLGKVLSSDDNYLNLLATCGYTKPLVNVTNADRREVVDAVCHYQVIQRAAMQIEQFKKGLQVLDILLLMRGYPDEFRTVLCYNPQPMTAQMMLSIFHRDRDEKRALASRIFSHWRQFVEETDDGKTDVKLADIFQFVTGLREVPPLGFLLSPVLSIAQDSAYPQASTCDNRLFLPDKCKSYAEFRKRMCDGILNAQDCFDLL